MRLPGTAKFDNYTQSDYERYVRLKGGPDMLDDSDPVAWFSMSSNKQDAIHLNDRFVPSVCPLPSSVLIAPL